MNEYSNEDYRFGTASFAEDYQLRQAGLFQPKGPQVGFYNNKQIYMEGDAPMITIGGAGSGKLRDLLGYVVCNSPGQPMVVLDPRGEMCAISHHVHAVHGDNAYSWNPFELHGLPNHACNPLDILDMKATNFHALCKFVVEGLIGLTGSENGKYFELRARDYLEKILKSKVEQHGSVSLPGLMRMINAIESDPAIWADQLEVMLSSHFAGVRRVAAEMITKQQDSPKEFGSIMGEIYASLGFLEDPTLCASLERSDFSLKEICHPNQGTKVFLNIPAEYLSLWSPLVRLFFTVSMLYKTADPSARRVLLLVDEAGQLGRFEALLRAFTFGRGAGVRAWAIFQDIGQIIRNFDQAAVQGFLGSAQMRQFFGVRDYQTAKLISDMLGMETLSYDDTARQEEARRRKMQAFQKFVDGGDPFSSAFEMAHYNKSAHIKSKQGRHLKTPSEIMDMPEDEQILFISGKDLPPVLANKYPYYQRREMAGKFLPNPFHPPIDRVSIATRFSRRNAKVIKQPVPKKYASFPQYVSGYWSYIDGYKPT